MNKEEEMAILIDRMYKLQEAYKGFTTRLRLIEAEVADLKRSKESLDLGNTQY